MRPAVLTGKISPHRHITPVLTRELARIAHPIKITASPQNHRCRNALGLADRWRDLGHRGCAARRMGPRRAGRPRGWPDWRKLRPMPTARPRCRRKYSAIRSAGWPRWNRFGPGRWSMKRSTPEPRRIADFGRLPAFGRKRCGERTINHFCALPVPRTGLVSRGYRCSSGLSLVQDLLRRTNPPPDDRHYHLALSKASDASSGRDGQVRRGRSCES